MNRTTTDHPVAVRALALALGALAALAAGGCTTTSTASADLARVVALGDSSAGGPGLGPRLPGSPPECDRTSGGYPELLARRVVVRQFVNETCSEAISSSLSAGSTGYQGSWIRPQLDALNGNETAVLLSIGDNDAGFGDVTRDCLFHDQTAEDVCTQKYVHDGVNDLIARAQSIAGGVGDAVDAVRRRATHAEIFLIGYLDIAPPTADTCQGLLWLTAADAPVFDRWEVAVNDTLHKVAGEHGARFVDAYAQSAGHCACAEAASARWINPHVGTT